MRERVVSVMTNEIVGLVWECQCWDDRVNRGAIRKVMHKEVTYGHEYVLIAKRIVINIRKQVELLAETGPRLHT